MMGAVNMPDGSADRRRDLRWPRLLLLVGFGVIAVTVSAYYTWTKLSASIVNVRKESDVKSRINWLRQFCLAYFNFHSIHGRPPGSLEEFQRYIANEEMISDLFRQADKWDLIVSWGKRMGDLFQKGDGGVLAVLVNRADGDAIVVATTAPDYLVLNRAEYKQLPGANPELPDK